MPIIVTIALVFMIIKTIHSLTKEEYKKISNYLIAGLIVEIVFLIWMLQYFNIL